MIVGMHGERQDKNILELGQVMRQLVAVFVRAFQRSSAEQLWTLSCAVSVLWHLATLREFVDY